MSGLYSIIIKVEITFNPRESVNTIHVSFTLSEVKNRRDDFKYIIEERKKIQIGL